MSTRPRAPDTEPMVRHALSLLFAFAVAAPLVQSVAPSRAWAAGSLGASPVDLDWEAPEGCADRAQIEAAIATLVGEQASTAPLVAKARIVRASRGGWTLEIATGTGNAGTDRELSGTSCQELTEAAITLIAVSVTSASIEGQASVFVAPPAPPAPSASPRGTATFADDRAPPVAPAAARRRIPLAVGAMGGASAGAVGTAAGLGVAVAWVPPGARVEAFGFGSPPKQIDAPSGASGRFALWTIGLRGCRTFTRGRLEGAPCVGVEAGEITGTGTGTNVADASTQHRMWAAGSAGGLVAVREGPLVVRLQLDVVVPLHRERFGLDGGDVVYRPSVVGGRLLSGIELRFP